MNSFELIVSLCTCSLVFLIDLYMFSQILGGKWLLTPKLKSLFLIVIAFATLWNLALLMSSGFYFSGSEKIGKLFFAFQEISWCLYFYSLYVVHLQIMTVFAPLTLSMTLGRIKILNVLESIFFLVHVSGLVVYHLDILPSKSTEDFLIGFGAIHISYAYAYEFIHNFIIVRALGRLKNKRNQGDEGLLRMMRIGKWILIIFAVQSISYIMFLAFVSTFGVYLYVLYIGCEISRPFDAHHLVQLSNATLAHF